MRLYAFDYFRALAILLIVSGHAIDVSTWKLDSDLAYTFSNIIHDGSALFVFISGFFYHRIFNGRLKFAAFMMKKSQYVLLPYLLLSVLALAYYFVTKGIFPGLDVQPVSFVEWAYYSSIYLLNGLALGPYWYVPFAYVVFLLSPLFDLFIRLSLKKRVLITSACFALAAITHRPALTFSDYSIVQSLFYYAPFYMFGIIYSMNFEKVNQLLKGKALVLIALVVLLSYLRISGFQAEQTSSTYWIVSSFDLNLLQKSFLVLASLAVLNKLEGRKFAPLTYVAAVSFPIFFLHPWAMSLLRKFSFFENIGGQSVFSFLLFFTATFLASVAATEIIKRATGRFSRCLIGA